MVFQSTKQSVRSPMETALIWCADIDAAIDKTGEPGRWLAICGDFNQKRLRILVNRHKLSWNQEMICEAFLFDELHKEKDNTVGPQQALKLVYRLRRELNKNARSEQ
jgi:hypothetical protein